MAQVVAYNICSKSVGQLRIVLYADRESKLPLAQVGGANDPPFSSSWCCIRRSAIHIKAAGSLDNENFDKSPPSMNKSEARNLDFLPAKNILPRK